MSDQKKKKGISWTDETWNPIIGCTKVSFGCDNCWAERMARLHYHADFPNGWDGHVKLFPERLEQPLRWRRPRKIAVGLMGDLFHEDVHYSYIRLIFACAMACPQHTFQVLTKRPRRMLDFFNSNSVSVLPVQWPLPNVWLGVSVENQQTADERIPLLLHTPAAVRFVSAEPLLGPIDLRYSAFNGSDSIQSLEGLHWVIVGGESGPWARPTHPDWVRSLRDQCVAAGVPFHFKQWGEYCWPEQMTEDVWRMVDAQVNLAGIPEEAYRVGKKAAGRMLDGKEWLEFPKYLELIWEDLNTYGGAR